MKKFEIINHGADHEQYFPGCGTAFSDYDHVVTGAGMDAKEAYEDAIEQVYQVNDNASELRLPKMPRGLGITRRHKGADQV